MPLAVQYFLQAPTLRPQSWSTPEQIPVEFDHEGHKGSFLTTLVTYVMVLQNIYNLWTRRIIDSSIGCLQSKSVERPYPLSPFQRAVFQEIVNSLNHRQRFLQQAADGTESPSALNSSWQKYRVLLGKPETGKSQVLIRVIREALQRNCSVFVAAPVALLAQGYQTIFNADLECDTARHLPDSRTRWSVFLCKLLLEPLQHGRDRRRLLGVTSII